MLTGPDDPRGPKRSNALARVARKAIAPFRTRNGTTSRSAESFRRVDLPKVLTWLGVSIAVSCIFGWSFGVLAAQPLEGFFITIGLIGVITIVSAAIAVVKLYYPSVVSSLVTALQSMPLFSPIYGNKRKTILWVVLAIVCGIVIGGVVGFFIGLQMAEAIANALKTLGQIIVAAAIAAVVVLIILHFLRRSTKG